MGSTLRNSNQTNERRLHDVHSAAAYLHVSVWTIRDYVARGILPTVQLPALETREGIPARMQPLRRVLIDRSALDHLIDKGSTARKP